MARILTITSWYPPHHFGGYELSCFDVMTRLVARGHDVRILCGNERLPGPEPPSTTHEQRVYRELRPHMREDTRERPPLRDRIAIERHNRASLARHLADHVPEVVSVWHMVAISGALLPQLQTFGVPIVYVVCDEWPAYVELLDAWLSLFAGGGLRSRAGRAVEITTGLHTSLGKSFGA